VNSIGGLVITHRPSGITGRGEDVLPEICEWLHRNQPEKLCFAEQIFADPTLNESCYVRELIKNERN